MAKSWPVFVKSDGGRIENFDSIEEAIPWAVLASSEPFPQKVTVNWVQLGEAACINDGDATVDAGAVYIEKLLLNAGALTVTQRPKK